MFRTVIETAPELTSLVMFGSAVAIWALALSPIA
jgi:hypothetical protein